MERNFANENFENFLRRNADGLRMRPNEKVWNEISKKLNRRKTAGGFTIGSILLAIFTLGNFAVEPGKLNLQENTNASLSTKGNSVLPPSETNENVSTAPVISMTASPVASLNRLSEQVMENRAASPDPANQTADFESTIVDDYPSEHPGSGTIMEIAATDPLLVNYPLTRESVVNLKPKNLKKKLGWQFYFTPTVSYRKLSENKTFLRSQNANGNPASYTDVNSVVTHRPDLGVEMGMAARLPLTRKMNLKTGFQFSINRFDIKAYNSNTVVATVMLNTRNNGVDSLNALTRYSNMGGIKTDWIENVYYHFSVPVGLEFILAGNKNVQFGVASTIQPTYVVGGKSYMITTDYKSYTEVPDLIRRWNVNTTLETFVGYSTGKLNWQIGPQLRYQLLSSFESEYPVKENLFSYGLRIGISANK